MSNKLVCTCSLMQTWTTRPTCSCMHVSWGLADQCVCWGWESTCTATSCACLPPSRLHERLWLRRSAAVASLSLNSAACRSCTPSRLHPFLPNPGGETLREAFENVGLCMFNYMTPLKGIGIDPALTRCAAPQHSMAAAQRQHSSACREPHASYACTCL